MANLTRAETRAATERAQARRRSAPTPTVEPSAFTDVARPPGPRSISTMLRLLRNRGRGNEVFADIIEAYHPVAHVRLAGEHVYLLGDPDLIIEVFLTNAREVMKGRGLQAARPLLGNGLLTSEGAFHLRQRRLAQPAFHRDRISDYARDMVSESTDHIAAWRAGQSVEMVEQMTSLTLAIVGRTLFGVDLKGDARVFGETLGELMQGFSRLATIGSERLVNMLPKGRELLAKSAVLDEVVQRIIDEHRAEHEAGVDRGDLLSWFIAASDDGEAMSDEQLRDEVMTMVLAGHETTAMALSWAWLSLSRNEDVRAKLHAELTTTLDGPPTIGDIARLPYTRAVVAETIRLHPPAWIMGRRTLCDMTLGGWQIPSNSIVLALPYVMHREPDVWPDPMRFDPQRWLTADGTYDEAAPGVPRGSWIPFGFGNRRCIGEQFAWTEAVLVLATIARDWDPRLVAGTKVDAFAGVTLRPRDGLPMVLRRR